MRERGDRSIHGVEREICGFVDAVPHRVTNDVHGAVAIDRIFDRSLATIRVHVGGERANVSHVIRCRIAFEVDQAQRQLHGTDAVGDGVMHPLHQRAPTTAQSLDERELPQRSGAVQRWTSDGSGEIEQTSRCPRLGDRDVPKVIVEIECRIRAPFGRRDAQRWRDDPLAEARDRSQCAKDGGVQTSLRWSAVQDRDVGEIGPEGRVLLDGPHHGFARRHPHAIRVLPLPASVTRPPGAVGAAEAPSVDRSSRRQWSGFTQRRSSRPSTSPTTAPPMTSDAKCMRT